MRTRRLGWVVLCASWALAAILVGPRPAAAQCPMMGGGSHNQSATHAKDSGRTSASQKKLQQSIDRLLSDDEGRALLADALLNDRAFMESLIQRLATIPKWRMVAVATFAPGPAGDSLGAVRPVTASAAVRIYVCPMHSEVTSAMPGDCPKCGMALVRAAPNGK